METLAFGLIAIICLSVALLIRSVVKKNTKELYFFKPLSTSLVILLCLLSLARPGVNLNYTLIIAAALLFSLGGDIALMFNSELSFLLGLGLFLVVQVTYGLTFTWFNGFQQQDFLLVLPVVIVISAAIYAFLYPGLGKMKLPVGCYVLITTFMAWRAAATLFGAAFPLLPASLITAGAGLFYLSDVILAVNKFKRPFNWDIPLNLLTYYAAQLLIVLSAFCFS